MIFLHPVEHWSKHFPCSCIQFSSFLCPTYLLFQTEHHFPILLTLRLFISMYMTLPVLVFTLNFGPTAFCSCTSLFLNTFSSDLTGDVPALLFMVPLFFSPFLHYMNDHKWLCDNQCASSHDYFRQERSGLAAYVHSLQLCIRWHVCWRMNKKCLWTEACMRYCHGVWLSISVCVFMLR